MTTIATRSALRVLPLSAELVAANVKGPRENFTVHLFRASAVLKAAETIPTQELRAAKNASKAAIASASTYASNTTAGWASTAAADAIDVAGSASAAISAGWGAAAAANAAGWSAGATISNATNTAAYAARAAVLWIAISADATALEDGTSAAELAAAPLWPDKPPDWVSEYWASLVTALSQAPDEDWGVWIDWYEARLRGDPPNEALERARVLEITNEMWEQGPKVVNAEIRRLINAHRPTRPQLEKTISPQPVIADGKLDVRPNDIYDSPDDREDLFALPSQQRAVIRVLTTSLRSNKNVDPGVVAALTEYDSELLTNGTRPALGTLNQMHQIVRDEYLGLHKEKFFDNQRGVRRSFLSFFANHKQIKTHFPLDAVRERMYRDTPVDRTKWDADKIRSLADEFIVTVKATETIGIAKPDFVKASLSIAESLKAATFAPPPPPVDAMQANRDLMEPPNLSAADRAVIRAMTFTDSLTHLLENNELSEGQKKTVKELGIGTAASLLATAILKAVFG